MSLPEFSGKPSFAVSASVIPCLCWGVSVKKEGDSALFQLYDTEFRFGGVPAETLLKIVSRFDAITTIGQIAEESAIDVNVALSILEKLFDLGLAVDLRQTPESDLTPQAFSSMCRRLFPIWKERLFSHRLWVILVTGEATRSQFLGWLLESYHFIEGVNVRLPLAIAECSDQKIRPLFAHHYSEEYDHSRFFLESLNALGMDTETVLSCRPLPATKAVLNFARQCARRDPLQYAVCSGFLESTGADRLRARAFYEHLAKNYASDTPGVIQPLVSHVNLDEDYGHNSMLENICQKLGPLPSRRASEALEACSIFVETLELWSTDIMRTYGRPDFFNCMGLNRYRPAIAT